MHEEKEGRKTFWAKKRQHKKMISKQKQHRLLRQCPRDVRRERKVPSGVWQSELGCHTSCRLWKEVWTFTLLELAAHFKRIF